VLNHVTYHYLCAGSWRKIKQYNFLTKNEFNHQTYYSSLNGTNTYIKHAAMSDTNEFLHALHFITSFIET